MFVALTRDESAVLRRSSSKVPFSGSEEAVEVVLVPLTVKNKRNEKIRLIKGKNLIIQIEVVQEQIMRCVLSWIFLNEKREMFFDFCWFWFLKRAGRKREKWRPQMSQ